MAFSTLNVTKLTWETASNFLGIIRQDKVYDAVQKMTNVQVFERYNYQILVERTRLLQTESKINLHEIMSKPKRTYHDITSLNAKFYDTYLDMIDIKE